MASKRRSNHEGTISQRGPNSWRAQITINGKRLSHSGKTKKECTSWLQEKQFDVAQGYSRIFLDVRVERYFQEWLEIKSREIKRNTLTQYKQLVKNYILPHLGDRNISEIRRRDIDQLYKILLEKGLGNATIRYVHRVIHNAFEEAVKSEYIRRNPAKYAKPPRYQAPEMKILEPNQISQFLANARGTRYEAVYHLAVTTGMRQGEILGLRWSDIRWQSAQVYIQRQIYKQDYDGFTTDTPKTKAGTRMISLSENCLQILREQKEKQAFLKQLAGSSWKENDLIFTSSIGTPIDRSNLRKDFIDLLEISNIPRIRFHDLRHTAASLMLNNRIPVLSVSKMLGHSKPSVTLDIYGHIMPGELDKVARLMDNLVTPTILELPQKAPISQNDRTQERKS